MISAMRDINICEDKMLQKSENLVAPKLHSGHIHRKRDLLRVQTGQLSTKKIQK